MVLINPTGISGSTREAVWSLPTTRATAIPLYIPAGAAALWLDPSMTTPNVLLGLVVNGVRYVLTPGTVLPLPTGTRYAQLYNASKTPSSVPGLAGYMALRAVAAAELPALQASRQTSDAMPPASYLFAGRVANGAVLRIPTHNLSGVRVTMRALDNAGGSPMTTPADFAATIAVGHQPQSTGADWNSLTAPAASDVLSLAPIDEENPGTGVLVTHGDLDMVATQANMSWDLPVVAGAAAVRLIPNVTAGTGALLTYCALIVEGR
ncbi:MAG: hypothetical protein KGL54_12410 [Sphingomonadales bacterium]|nr:hypothetical protein [Sphingomonadales bacterium]